MLLLDARASADARTGATPSPSATAMRASGAAKAVAEGDAKLAAVRAGAARRCREGRGDKVFVVHDARRVDATSGARGHLPDAAEDVINNNRMRGELEAALASLSSSRPMSARAAGHPRTGQASLDESQLPMVEKALAAESRPSLKAASRACAPPS
ncbi:MAG: hypothetical protein QM796_12605 [Chthoniobacteraceae bacterium]